MPGKHGKDKEKDMGAHLDEEKEMGAHDKEKDEEMNQGPGLPPREREQMMAKQDLYTTAEKAMEKAKEMGIEGYHEHIHMVDDEEMKVYMPGETHEQYMDAKRKMMEAHEDKEEDMGMGLKKEEDMRITPRDVHTDKPMKRPEDTPLYSQSDCDCEENKSVCDCEQQKNNSLEQTFNINGVEIFSEGVWNGDKYGAEDLNSMIENFEETGFQPPLKLGHNEAQPEMKDGEPALGYVDKIYKEGSKLLADFKEIPKKVYEAMKRGNYKRVSSEIFWNYKNNGKVLDRVLKAVALLGAEVPAVTNLESITGLYSKSNAELKIYDKGVELVETSKDYSLEVANLKEKLAKVESEKEAAVSELNQKNEEIKSESIAQFINEAKAQGKVLPVFEEELKALMSHTSDEKIYKYTQDEKEVELSQFELVKKIFSSMPKLVELSEVSEEGELPEGYTNAGEEADRRAKVYLQKGKAETYRDALYKVLENDKELKDKYEKGE